MRGVATFRGAACLIAVCFVAISCRERQVQAVDPGATDSVILGARELKVGDLAPDFSLPGSDGKIHELASYRGRQAVVLAWFAKAFTGA
jgi:AhpC/TSA family